MPLTDFLAIIATLTLIYVFSEPFLKLGDPEPEEDPYDENSYS